MKPSTLTLRLPTVMAQIQSKTEELGFDMPADQLVGTLLRSLVAAKPAGSYLELGTGLGLSLAWMVEGMDEYSTILTLDNDDRYTDFVSRLFTSDKRVTVECTDGKAWLDAYRGPGFDLIFADTWPGKYHHLDEALGLLNPGGIYLIDDMIQQDNWPEGHAEKASALLGNLRRREGLCLSILDWSSGVVIAVKRPGLGREITAD